jgi:HAD superfamily hydrolase (TIGR01549 family)
MAFKAVIFDLDGTITKPFFDFDAIRLEMGLSKDAGPVWEAMAKMPAEQRKKAETILSFHEQRAVTESSLNPGAGQTLQALRQAGLGIGILTRNTKANAFAVAEKHGLKFDVVVGREQGPVKPDAFGVKKICEHFAIEPRESMVVGDYLFDIMCAKAAGAVAVLLNNHSKAGEFAEYADFVIDKLEQVLEIVHRKE